ncbi:class III signal peptide-containing protein [Candidatus Micrarchaeota archaeon]|nr:class III signal peptide-containing protein [Candidatus Micrarchaeota archaeon]
MNSRKAQTALEYMILLAGILVVIVLLTIMIRGGIFIPAQNEINTSVATIKGFGSALASP